MLQTTNINNVASVLKSLVEASALSTADASKLTAFVQSQSNTADDDELTAAPAAAAYKGQSGGIIDTLANLGKEAEGQLDEARKKEQVSIAQYTMLKQSLTDSIKFANQDSTAAKKSLSESAETQAVAKGDLEVSSK